MDAMDYLAGSAWRQGREGSVPRQHLNLELQKGKSHEVLLSRTSYCNYMVIMLKINEHCSIYGKITARNPHRITNCQLADVEEWCRPFSEKSMYNSE